MAQVSSISRVGTTEPFELQISHGQIPWHTSLFKYGYNPAIINVEETIWDGGGVYSYPGSALAMTVTSASGATDAGVTGIVFGLDADYNEVSEAFTLDGSGTYTTTKIPEKSDVEVRAICNKNQSNAVSASFDGIIVEEAV